MGKIYVAIESKILAGDKGATAALNAPNVKKKLVAASNKAAVRGLPRRKFSNKESAKPEKNDRPYDALKLMPKVKLSMEKKGSNLKVTANVAVEVGTLKVKTKKVFMMTTNISSKGAVDGRGKFVDLAVQVAEAVVEPLVKKLLESAAMKAKLKSKGFDV